MQTHATCNMQEQKNIRNTIKSPIRLELHQTSNDIMEEDPILHFSNKDSLKLLHKMVTYGYFSHKNGTTEPLNHQHQHQHQCNSYASASVPLEDTDSTIILPTVYSSNHDHDHDQDHDQKCIMTRVYLTSEIQKRLENKGRISFQDISLGMHVSLQDVQQSAKELTDGNMEDSSIHYVKKG